MYLSDYMVKVKADSWHRVVSNIQNHKFLSSSLLVAKTPVILVKTLVTKILFLCVHSEWLCSAGKKPVSHTILFLNTWLFGFNKVTGFHHNSAIFPLGWVPLDLEVKISVTLAFLLTPCGVFHLHHAANVWVIFWIMQMGILSSAFFYISTRYTKRQHYLDLFGPVFYLNLYFSDS